MRAEIGIIGGSGLYDMSELTDREDVRVDTPFGDPSGPYVLATLRGRRVAFLARHGAGHRISPSELNFRANIFGFKALGVEYILSASAVGSLKEEYKPMDLVIPDQFMDRTRGRISTFFGRGLVGHVGFAHPFCSPLSELTFRAAKLAGATVHKGGTYVCMEGPQFSTRAESRLYRSWGADVIGMTNLTEARLAREAEICYATLALVTDWDCWREATEAVSVEAVLAVLSENADAARRTMRHAVSRVEESRSCACRDALRYAILTDPNCISEAAKERLRPIAGRYF
jgi:5'-methylthioadenosine phosphorylase